MKELSSFDFSLSKQLVVSADAATVGKEAGVTRSSIRSSHPTRKEWSMPGNTSTVVSTECLSLNSCTHDYPVNIIVVSLAFPSTVLVGTIFNLALLAESSKTIVWLVPVSGMQFSSRLSDGA